jgi:hypothetical protein
LSAYLSCCSRRQSGAGPEVPEEQESSGEEGQVSVEVTLARNGGSPLAESPEQNTPVFLLKFHRIFYGLIAVSSK